MIVTYNTDEFFGPECEEWQMLDAAHRTPNLLGTIEIGQRLRNSGDPNIALFLCWEDDAGREFWLAYDPRRNRVMAYRPLRLPIMEAWLQVWIDRIDRWVEFLTGGRPEALDRRVRTCYEDDAYFFDKDEDHESDDE